MTTVISDLPEQMIEWQVEEWIRDYNFMLKEIARLNRIINKPEPRKQKLTATYGIEATMPKGSGLISQAELNRLDRKEKRLFKYLAIVEYLDKMVDELDDDKQKVVYECMLEGISYTQIAKHLGCSRDTLRKVKEDIIVKFVKNIQKDQFPRELKSMSI
ncbi:sigma factor-like helix-turn-helix DNA-binding protein [Priestia megaterium]|uniref:sigma factor-like helix-turn-helix DNA-binding protein n=1 Tax=Priestia megaterium TaxID=1404 RepID=UPI0027A5F0C5|nr:sigma factor-like helix-turn-helix DNA-binding protein [Priestia megaterium]WDC90553.1 sigma factor-like helix-turn-helix DNA-binding protein [Priestia megaterium]